MLLRELKELLTEHSYRNIRFVLPTGTALSPHAHVTEVARIDKKFVDCGGTFRSETRCQLQAWFADDTEHRLPAGKLLAIIDKSSSILGTEDLEVDVEHEAPFISSFPISSVTVKGEALLIQFGITHTACLAPDKCMPPTKPFQFTPLPKIPSKKCCS